MKNTALFLAMALFGALLIAAPCVAADYSVYCANGKIEVDTRTESEMKSARGGKVSTLSRSSNRTDAEKYAKQRGGIGASCN